MRYRDAMAILDDALPDGADVVVDAGNSGAAAVHQLPVRPAGRFVIALGMGGMGYSFGAGIGCAFARGRRTVVIAGRRGVLHARHGDPHCGRVGLPITFVLFNNNAHAMCVTREQLFYDDHTATTGSAEPNRGRAGSDVPGLPSRDVESLAALPEGFGGASAWRAFGRERRVLRRRDPAVRTISRQHRPRRRPNPMSLAALEDIADPLDGVVRIETSPREKATPIIMEMMRSVYPHDQVFGEYCTVNEYVDCPPDEVYEYLADTRSLEEWTYSLAISHRPKNRVCGSRTTAWARKPRSTPAPSPIPTR